MNHNLKTHLYTVSLYKRSFYLVIKEQTLKFVVQNLLDLRGTIYSDNVGSSYSRGYCNR